MQKMAKFLDFTLKIVQTHDKGVGFIEPKSNQTQNGYSLRPYSPVMKVGGRIENTQFCAVLRWHMGDGGGIWALLGACRPLYALLLLLPPPTPVHKTHQTLFLGCKMAQSPQPNNPITGPHIPDRKF